MLTCPHDLGSLETRPAEAGAEPLDGRLVQPLRPTTCGLQGDLNGPTPATTIYNPRAQDRRVEQVRLRDAH